MDKPFIVFANGCFDILHPGHYNFLMYCNHLTDLHRQYKHWSAAEFIVAIDSDEKVRKDKGKGRPIFTQKERAEALYNIGYKRQVKRGHLDCRIIHEVKFFNTNEELETIIRELVPDIMVKGESWKGKVVGEKWAKRISYYPEDRFPFSTTQIVEKVKKASKRK